MNDVASPKPSPRATRELVECVEHGQHAEDYEGATDCPHGCEVEPDGTCPHGWESAMQGLI